MAATVARQQIQPPATSVMARVERLDLLLGYMEEMHGNGNNGKASPPASATTASSPSTPAGGGHRRGLVSSDDDDDDSSAASTPRGIGTGTGSGSKSWRGPRPAKEVLEEARAKGSLIDRIAFLEHRVLKMEEDMEITSADTTEKASHDHHLPRETTKDDHASSRMRKKKKRGLKSLVKSCVRGKLKTKD